MRRVALRGGGAVWAPSARDVRVLERESSAADAFALAPGDRVVDLGANVGLLSIGLVKRHGRLRLLMVEPNPAVFAALARNAAEHLAGCEVALADCAVGEAAGWAELEVDPRLTVTGSTAPESFAAAARLDAPGRAWIAAGLRDAARLGEVPTALAALAIRALGIPLLGAAIVVAFGLLHRLDELDRRRRVRRVRRPVRPISQLLSEHGIERVDLLKVDVEGAELAALRGIAEADWPKIRQLLVEVHDVDGRIGAIEAMLRRRGYQVRRQPDRWALHDLLGIATLEAVRP